MNGGSANDRDAELADLLHEWGQLKRVPRSGWTLAGVDRPESVAEHSHRTALVAAVLARAEGGDPGRAALLAVLHDGAESRLGDLHRLARPHVDKRAAERSVHEAQTAKLAPPLRQWLRDLLGECESSSSLEARAVKDADRIEMLLQAREYACSGHDTQEWQRSALAELGSESARRLAAAVLATDPRRWCRSEDPGGTGSENPQSK